MLLPPSVPPAQARQGWVIVGRVKGVMLLGTIAVMVAAAFFVRPLLAGVLSDNKIAISGVSKLYFDAPWLVAVLSIPAIAATAPLLKGCRRPILWMTISTLLLLVPLAFFLLGAVGGVVQIYADALDG